MTNYVKEYKGHKVPEGAQCFVKACEAYKTHFGKSVNGIEYVFTVDNENPEWNEISDLLPLSTRGAIPLPQEPESKEWVDGLPPVGCGCEVESDIRGVWKKAMYVGVDSIGSHVFDVEKTHLWRIDSIDVLVRPLKTEKEKERDAFVDACFAVSCALHNNANEHSFNDLFDAGFKAPEGG